VSRSKSTLFVCLLLTALMGCGDNSSVRVCVGDVAFCNSTFNPVARAGADQTVAAGDTVTLDGSSSQANGGSIRSFSWTQTAGPAVTLTNANTARATFVAPGVAVNTTTTFRLTVVNDGNRADSASTVVTVRPAAAAALATALDLFDGALQPALMSGSAPDAHMEGMEECGDAMSGLPADQTSAQLGLWLAARSIAIAKGVDTNDPSAFLDASRVLVTEHATPSADVAGEVESFGFLLLGSLAQERDPALRDAVVARDRDAKTLDDPAALLSGRSEVMNSDGVVVETVNDPAAATASAIQQLLAARSRCVDSSQAFALTAAGWRVVAAAAAAE